MSDAARMMESNIVLTARVKELEAQIERMTKQRDMWKAEWNKADTDAAVAEGALSRLAAAPEPAPEPEPVVRKFRGRARR